MKKLSLDDFMKLRKLVYRGARPLEFTMWKTVFEHGDPEEFLAVLASYQNEDGGFGHALEANLWNPNSSPYVTIFAIDLMARMHYVFSDNNHPMVQGILKYFATGEYVAVNGMLGYRSLPSNNDYSHAPWFGYDPSSEPGKTDPRNFVDFILKYGCKDSELYLKALEISKAVMNRSVPDFSDYDPSIYQPWMPMPTDFADSPDSPNYPALKTFVDAELDAMVDRLRSTGELPVNEIKNRREWEDSRQIIGGYYWESSDFISEIEILNNFSRLDFQLPIQSQ